MTDIERMMELMKRPQKPVFLANMVSPPIKDTEVSQKLLQSYLGPYPTLERAAQALAHLVEYSEYLGIARRQ
jgi:acyl-CoA synthetase (NDP forming)